MGGGAPSRKKRVTPWNVYYCPYILRTGEVCNRRCYDPKGCKAHRDSRQVACKESGCDEMTSSKYDYCDTHAKKHRSREHYHRKKQAKIASKQILVGNLEVIKNNTT